MASDGKVVISTALDNDGIRKGVKEIKGSLGGLNSVIKTLGTTIAAVFSIRQIVSFMADSSVAARELSDALTGLQRVLEGQGRSFSKAQSFIEEYTADGLIPAANAIAAYKNLALRGYDDSQIRQVMQALKDASAYGRQASYTMGEAVQSATEGLKNENSILVDNAGVTKNVAKMWEEYAESIGTTANNLTKAQKIQAEVNGILEETKYQTGDAATVAGTLSGQLLQLSFNFNNLKVAVGNVINPIAGSFLPIINAAIAAVTRLANALAMVISLIFGKVSTSSGNLAESNKSIAVSASAGAAAEEDLAKATSAAGKAAKKSLASFDELNKLQGASGGGGAGGTGGGASAGGIEIEAGTEVEDTVSPKLQAIADKIQELLAPLQQIDFTHAVEAFGRLKEAIEPITAILFEGLEWVWFDILVPLAEWTVEDSVPAFFELLAAALGLLNSAVIVLQPAAEWLWDEFLQPLAEWSGDTIIDTLGELTDLFLDLSDLLSGDLSLGEFLGDLTAVQTILLSLVTVFGAIKTVSAGMTAFQIITGFLKSIKALNATSLIGKIAEVLMLTATGANTLSGAMKTVFGPGSIIAGIGGVIGGAVLAVSNFFSMLEGGFSWANEALMLLGLAITTVGAIILGAPATVAGVIAAIVAAVTTAVVVIKDNWATISGWFDKKVIQPVSKFFSRLWKDISKLASEAWENVKDTWNAVAAWFDKKVIQPVTEFFSELWDDISATASDCWDAIVHSFTPAIEWFSELFGSIEQTLADIFYNIGVIAKGCWEVIQEAWNVASEWFDENVIQPVSQFFSDLWTSVSRFASDAWTGIQETLAGVASWIDSNVIRPVSEFFSGLWEGFSQAASDAWEGVKEVFSTVAEFFSKTFGAAWEGIVKIFSVGGEIFTDIKDGIIQAFKKVVNGIIGGLNKVISVPFNGINTALRKIKNINILGLTPFSGLKTISVPQIPYLAQGAVLPANKPFLAMVGDQKHGTNVEAPLATIQEAVAIVMEDMIQSNIAGHEATLAVLQSILEAIYEIDTSDERYAKAVDTYNRKMAVARGGT